MSAEKDAVKRFISHMHQSWDQLQVQTSQVCYYLSREGLVRDMTFKILSSFHSTCIVKEGLTECTLVCPVSLFSLSGLSNRVAGHGNNDSSVHP